MKKIKLSAILCLLLAVVCVLYGGAIFAVHSGKLFFAVWEGMGLGFLVLAICHQKCVWKKLPKLFKSVLLILLVLGISVFGTIEAKVIGSFSAKGEAGLDYVIVLGAQVYQSGPSVVLNYRLRKAVEYLEANPETKCIVSGGQGFNEPAPEAEVMAEYLEKKGIDRDRITVENTSQNTTQNIENSMALVDLSNAKVGIITNNFHVYRGVGIALKHGLDAQGIAAGSTPFYVPNNAFREFFGVVKDLLKGNMKLF